MKLTIFKCDNCGKEYREDNGRSVDFLVGYSPDPVSGKSEGDYKSSDLCSKCLIELLEYVLKQLEMPVRVGLAKAYKAT